MLCKFLVPSRAAPGSLQEVQAEAVRGVQIPLAESRNTLNHCKKCKLHSPNLSLPHKDYMHPTATPKRSFAAHVYATHKESLIQQRAGKRRSVGGRGHGGSQLSERISMYNHGDQLAKGPFPNASEPPTMSPPWRGSIPARCWRLQ